MTDSDFYALSATNWSAQADKLVSEGWERKDWSNSIIPVTFHKEVDGNECMLYLASRLGDTKWYVKQLV